VAHNRIGLQTKWDPAIERLYREQAARVWRAVYAYAGDREVASDAVAEAFAQCLGRGAAVRDRRAWVWRAAFRIAAGELQQRLRFSGTVPERAYDLPEVRPELATALASLSPRQRAALVLTYYGYSGREIGEILGMSGVTARVHLSQARKKLRDLLGDDS
jgi:RNA polymerase sigma-70 factor (ECF subfamily)